MQLYSVYFEFLLSLHGRLEVQVPNNDRKIN